MDWTQIIVALITSGSVVTAAGFGRKAWQAREDAGYQRRVKEEQAEEYVETIGELEAENVTLTDDVRDKEARIAELERFVIQQQGIISQQADALAACKRLQGGGA